MQEIITKEPTSPYGWDFINDLSAVNVDENDIIAFLLHRLGREKIYTWVGPLLLALNPEKNILHDIYDEKYKKKFINDEKKIFHQENPHIYGIASRARYRLVNNLGKISQVIVISGESGTGKTFNARKALDFLGSTNEKSNDRTIKNSEARSIKNFEAPSINNSEAPSVKNFEASSIKNFEAPSIKNSEAPSIKNVEAPSINNSEAPSVKNFEASSIKIFEAPSIKNSEAPSIKNFEAPSIKNFEASSIKIFEAPSIENFEAPSIKNFEAPSIENFEAPSIKNFEAPSIENFEAPSIKNFEAPSIKNSEAPSIIKKIGNIFPLLSAFSTASTEKNSRSSRHGQLLRLQYDDKGVIKGASIDSFLLERSRVTSGKNNFEIFYQLIVGLTDREIDDFGLSRNDYYKILKDFDKIYCQNFNEGFRDTLKAFEALDFTNECKIEIFRIIALLLHMGNIKFVHKSDEGCTIDLQDEESKKALNNVCCFTSLRHEEIIELLTTTLICPQSLKKMHTSYRRELKTPEDCQNRLFSIIRYIYDKLFNWLVERVNESISSNDQNCHYLGILDIFGFESFEINGLEQFCINYSTERLQLYFMEDYLEAGQRELREEGLKDDYIQLSSINIYRERISIIEEIVFSIFNDACQLPLAPNVSSLRDQFDQKLKKENFLKIKNDAFVIEHYSCPVKYEIMDFLSKNTDKVPTELSSIFDNCENKLLRSLSKVEEENIFRNGCRVSMKKFTALAKLKKSLDRLVEELKNCDAHYVRCTKPRQVDGMWEKNEFRKQLACTGIFDALPLARCKFPIKFSYEEFYKRYSIKPKESRDDLIRYLSAVINNEDYSASIHFGKKIIFLTEAIFFELEHYRRFHRYRCAKKIQSFWMKNRQKLKARTKNISNLIINESVKREKNCQIFISVIKKSQISLNEKNDNDINEKLSLAQQDQENNYYSFESEKFDKKKNIVKKMCDVPSSDTGYHTAVITTEKSSDITKKNFREELQIDEATKFQSKKFNCDIDEWKMFYIRNWIENTKFNSDENFENSKNFEYKKKFSKNDKFPKNSTVVVDLNDCQFFYRNRILSRRRPVEIPIRFHIRLTCLPNSHRLPRELVPRGLQDCLAEKY